MNQTSQTAMLIGVCFDIVMVIYPHQSKNQDRERRSVRSGTTLQSLTGRTRSLAGAVGIDGAATGVHLSGGGCRWTVATVQLPTSANRSHSQPANLPALLHP